MSNNLVKEYYDKMLDYSKEYGSEGFLRQHKNEIKQYLFEIINKNNNYLLTDSILNYLSSTFMVLTQLKAIAEDKEFYKMVFLHLYFETCLNGMFFGTDGFTGATRFIKLMDDECHAALFDAHMMSNRLKQNYRSLKYRRIMNDIISYTLAHCFLNNKMHEFEVVCNNIISKADYIIDDLEMNKIGTNNADFDYRMISIFNEINDKKEIV